jgi:hypothetical protein
VGGTGEEDGGSPVRRPGIEVAQRPAQVENAHRAPRRGARAGVPSRHRVILEGRFAMDQVTRCRQCEQTPVPMQGWVCCYCQSFEPLDRADRWIELSDTRSSYRLLVRVLRAWRAVLVGANDSGLPMPPSPWDDPAKWRE